MEDARTFGHNSVVFAYACNRVYVCGIGVQVHGKLDQVQSNTTVQNRGSQNVQT